MGRERCVRPEHGAARARFLAVRFGAHHRTSSRFMSYAAQAEWPQSQAISVSSEPASLHGSLQYFSPLGGTHRQGTCAHFSDFSVAMMNLLMISKLTVAELKSGLRWYLSASRFKGFEPGYAIRLTRFLPDA